MIDLKDGDEEAVRLAASAERARRWGELEKARLTGSGLGERADENSDNAEAKAGFH